MHSRVEGVSLTRTRVPSNPEQSRMLRFRPPDVDTANCRIFFGFVDTGVGVETLLKDIRHQVFESAS